MRSGGSVVSFVRGLGAAALCAVLLACGGGGGSSPPPEDAQVSSSGTLGPAGGTLGTAGLRLELPAGALERDTPITLLSFTPEPGELARFRFAPAGLRLQQPATLRLGNLPAGAQLYWQIGGETVLLPSTVEGSERVARISLLGFTASGGVLEAGQASGLRRTAGREAPQDTASSGSGDLVALLGDCARDMANLKTRLRNADQLRDMARAQAIDAELKALTLNCMNLEIEQLQLEACQGLTASVARANASPARSFEDVRQRTVSLLASQAYVQNTGAECTGDLELRAAALVSTVFDQFLGTLLAGIRDGSLSEDATVRDMTLLLQYEAECQTLGLEAVCDRFPDQIYPDLLDAMRRDAFNECRESRGTLVMAQLHAMGARHGDEQQFLAYARYSLNDVRRDISYCTDPRVELRVFDDALDTPVEITERRQNLRLAPALGDYRPLTITHVPRDGSLYMSGIFRGQRCADGSQLPAELVVRLSTIEITRRRLNGNGDYDFNAQPLDLVISRMFEQTGVSPEIDDFRLSFHLEGGQCVLPATRSDPEDLTVLNQRETLFEVDVTLPSEEPPAPGLFKGPIFLNMEYFEPGYVRQYETVSFRDSITVEGEFEQTGPLAFRINNARVTLNSRSTIVDRRSITIGSCSYQGVGETNGSGQINATLPELRINGGLEILRDARSLRLSGMWITVDLPYRSVLNRRYENVQGDCSGRDLSSSTEIEEAVNNAVFSFPVSDPDTGRSVINIPITGTEETGLAVSVNAGSNVNGNNGSYRRASVTMQLRDR